MSSTLPRLVRHAKREKVAKIEIEAEDDAAVCTRQRNDLSIRSALQAERSNVSCFVTKLFQELDSLRRDSGVGQESHG